MNSRDNYIPVWDRFVRFFHWMLVIVFSASYLSAEYKFDTVHSYCGYVLCLLLVTRVIWGFVGSHHARFRNFAFSPGEFLRYLRTLPRRADTVRHIGHNPAGAWMVLLLISLLLTTCITGLATLGVIDFDGPLWWLLIDISDTSAQWIRTIHETTPEILLVLIATHLTGVIVSSWLHRENLVTAMITGYKRK